MPLYSCSYSDLYVESLSRATWCLSVPFSAGRSVTLQNCCDLLALRSSLSA